MYQTTSTLYCLEKDKAQHYWIILADNLLSGRYMNLYRHLLDRPMNKSIKQKDKIKRIFIVLIINIIY